MKNKVLFSMFMLACLIVFPLHAQVTGLEITFGIVVEASATQIVILEYDYEEDLEKEVAYLIDPETQYEEVESYQELEPGDPVEIMYSYQGDKKVAETIKKEVLSEEDEGLDWPEDLPDINIQDDQFDDRG